MKSRGLVTGGSDTSGAGLRCTCWVLATKSAFLTLLYTRTRAIVHYAGIRNSPLGNRDSSLSAVMCATRLLSLAQ